MGVVLVVFHFCFYKATYTAVNIFVFDLVFVLVLMELLWRKISRKSRKRSISVERLMCEVEFWEVFLLRNVQGFLMVVPSPTC